MIYDDPRPENIRSTIGWTVFVLVLGYVVVNALVPNNDVNIGVSVLVGTTATMVLCFYLMTAIKAIWTGSDRHTDYLIVGIVLSWISQDGQAWLSVAARLSGFSPILMNSELFAPLKLLSVVAAVLHVIPRGAADGVVPRSNKAAVFGFLGLAGFLAVLILVVKPDLSPWIDRMPGWSRDWFSTGAMLMPKAPSA